MSSLPAFDRPKESIAVAREAIHELDAAFGEFFRPKPAGAITDGRKVYGQVVDIDPETGNEVHKFKIFEPLPRILSRRTAEALLNIRESWNQAVYAACVSINKVPRRQNLHFPWRSSPADLDATLKKGAIPPNFGMSFEGRNHTRLEAGTPGATITLRKSPSWRTTSIPSA